MVVERGSQQLADDSLSGETASVMTDDLLQIKEGGSVAAEVEQPGVSVADTLRAPEHEQLLWEDRWIQCAKRLNQWDVLLEFAKSDGQNDLVQECAWRMGEWDTLKEALVRHSFSSDNAQLMVYRAISAVMSNNGRWLAVR